MIYGGAGYRGMDSGHEIRVLSFCSVFVFVPKRVFGIGLLAGRVALSTS
jgi:hypothetical protein